MFLALQHFVLQTVLALALMVPGWSALLMGGGDFQSLRNAYEQTVAERTSLHDAVAELEAQHRGLVARIDLLKRSGTDGFASRRQLEALLREAKSLADSLERLQGELRGVDGRLRSQKGRLAYSIDERVAELEQRLASASPGKRRAIVRELNELQQDRAEVRRPLPVSSSASQALSLASDIDSENPDELRAAADELEDTQDQLRRRAAALDERINELDASRRLARRARSFTAEERFFDDDSRGRSATRVNTVSRRPTDRRAEATATGGTGDEGAKSTADNGGGANNAAEFADDGNAAPAAGQAFTDSDGADNDALAGAADPAPPENDQRATTGGGEEPGGVAQPPVDNAPSYDVDQPFVTSTRTIVLGGQVDPNRTVGSSNLSSEADLEHEMRKLADEKKKLEKAARKLSKRAAELRTRAQKLD